MTDPDVEQVIDVTSERSTHEARVGGIEGDPGRVAPRWAKPLAPAPQWAASIRSRRRRGYLLERSSAGTRRLEQLEAVRWEFILDLSFRIKEVAAGFEPVPELSGLYRPPGRLLLQEAVGPEFDRQLVQLFSPDAIQFYAGSCCGYPWGLEEDRLDAPDFGGRYPKEAVSLREGIRLYVQTCRVPEDGGSLCPCGIGVEAVACDVRAQLADRVFTRTITNSKT